MPKVSDEYKEKQRRHIIDSAYRCFARKGFHQTTMRDIFDEAELSAGAIYRYFSSKDAIIQASFDFDYRRSFDRFHAASYSPDPLQALIDLIDFLFHGLKSAAALGAGRVNVQGWGEALLNPALGAARREVIDHYLEALAEVIRHGQQIGQVDRALDPRSMARVLLSLYYGLELQRALDEEVDIDSYAAAVRALLRPATRPE